MDQDRDWAVGDTNKTIRDAVKKSREAGEELSLEPMICPKCARTYRPGDACPACGAFSAEYSRTVIQVNGDLKQIKGPAIKPKAQKPYAKKCWDDIYFPVKNSKSGARGMSWHTMLAVFKNKHPDIMVYQTVDNTGRDRIAAFHGGKITFLPTPPLNDRLLWDGRVKDTQGGEILW